MPEKESTDGDKQLNLIQRQLEFDSAHIWHPYSTMALPPPVFHVKSADGVRIQLSSGESLIDGMSSWWSVIHGYNHPQIVEAITEQAETLSHVMFGGLTHEPAITLAEKLIAMAPANLERVFFADSGSVAVEVAIKMALQYWQAMGKSAKSRLLTIRGGYHGDTFGAMAVCDPVTGMHSLFNQVLPEHLFAPRPNVRFDAQWRTDDTAALERLFEAHHHELAALILEPIVQGAGGMWFYHSNYLSVARALCEEYDVLLICDEIATGFGRSGALFASQHAEISPDIMCVGKALTGGYMTLAATLATASIAETISQHEPGVFMHGPTFMANPLACTSANASLALLQSNHWQNQVAAIENQLKTELAACAQHKSVADVRVLGAIGVVELREPVDMRALPSEFVKRGVWVRPFGKLLYIMPPYVISPSDLTTLNTAIYEVADLLSRS
ncbi:MAG: adenosylmethionine--8-amino-7-oxononanoate transaminase [Pseudomonadota bacterium]